MPTTLSLPALESALCDLIARELRIPRTEISPTIRLIKDLNLDSLEFIELLMAVEDLFDVSLSNQIETHPACKAIFTRPDFAIRDFAELIHLQRDTTRPAKRNPLLGRYAELPPTTEPFTQLPGRFARTKAPLLEPLGKNRAGFPLFRRRTDGMLCVRLPAAENIPIGSNASTPFPDEHPAHTISLSSFLIDIEPVSTTAYARFLNSITPPDEATLRRWFILDPNDRRRPHELLHRTDNEWSPLPGTERFPMILVSWHGAAAYSQWANTATPTPTGDDPTFLPSEAQWEYAARGATTHNFPWGNAPADPTRARFALHQRGHTYEPHELLLAPVTAPLGLSPFGLRHMAGNVWHWCRDSYAPDFYHGPAARLPNPCNTTPTNIRSERGGSWLGPDFLCRSSYRRGRVPTAKGRCLGFRCVTA